MIVYRISNKQYKDDITGNGAAIYGARWNSVGIKALYTSHFISLSILESLCHLRHNYIPGSQYLLQIETPELDNLPVISLEKMKQNWYQEAQYTQWIGDQFFKNNESLMLKVPSAVVHQEHNFLINPLHKDFKKVEIVSTELLNLDKRLLMQ
jgi:RES domain-containing protein